MRLVAASAVATSSSAAGADGFDGDNTWSDNHTISQGDTGDNVAFWQSMTQSMAGPCSGHNITGHFGSRTNDLTAWFQAIHNLTSDGIVGPNTWTSAKSHMEYQYSDGDMAYLTIGWGWGHYGPGEPHYASFGKPVAKNTAAATNAWKRYGAGGNWYGTNHPGVSTPAPGEPPFCD